MISVVIPNYNGSELLSKNLPRLLDLLQKSKLAYEIIVVDDASTDDSDAVLSSLARRELENGVNKVQIIKNKMNKGFPSTADTGIRAAKGEIVFVIKNDAVPEKGDYFRLMQEHFKDPKVFAVSAASKTTENGKDEIRGQGRIVFFRGMFLHFRSKEEYLQWLKTTRTGRATLEKMNPFNSAQGSSTSKGKNYSSWPDGSSSAYRRDLYLKLGGFDPLYNPGYWEDVDLGYRAWKAGYRVLFEPKAILLHDYEQSVFKKKYGPEKLHLINLRNQFIFTWKNADWPNLLRFYLWEIYNHLASLKSGDRDFVKAYWLAALKWPAILETRLSSKKLNKLTDKATLAIFEKNII